MAENDANQNHSASTLRKRAEEKSRAGEATTQEMLSPEAARQVLHELRVHQIQLEMQNEELRRAQAELEASRARYFDLYDLAPVGYFTVSEQGVILEANLTAALLLGVARGALVKQPLTRFIVHEDQDSYYLHRKQLLETGAPQECEFRMLRADAAPFWARLEATAAQGADGAPVFRAVISDITERKRAEEELTRLAMAVEQAAEAILITDARGIINYVNPAFCRLTGYDRGGVIGQTPKIIHSGKQDGAFYEVLRATIRSGEIWSGRFVNMRKDGALFETEASISPVLNGAGEIVNYVGVERDVTESVALEGQIRHMQKMEAIGALAGGIAHDFNNVLAAIIGYGQIAADELPAGSTSRSDLDHILLAADRAKELVHQILTFSRQVEEARRSVEPHFIVREALKLLRPSLPSTIEIRENIRKDSGAVLADVTQLHQVIMNLCTNAYHAMKDRGGILEIGLESCRVDGELARAVPGLREQDYVRLSVRDTGCGMDDQTIRRIFDPFFTTKPVGEGTGMGLAITDSIVRAHGGAITVSSEVGVGTLFEVYLPRVDARIVEAPAVETTVPGGHERILVVDDEHNVVEVIERILEGLGYQVTSVTNSLEALKIVRANPDLFDLVITDQTMPKLRGDQLAAEIHALRPSIPVIWSTGCVEENVDEKTGLLGFSALIRKPWPLHAVARTVREVLDGVAADCT
jgi:PAS domain S-box-containing protein